MAEEQRWQEPEGHRLCANNCGFFGSPTTLDLCSKCYKDHRVKEQQASKAKLAVEKSLTEATSSSSSSAGSLFPVSVVPEAAVVAPVSVAVSPEVAAPAVAVANRCGSCRRRVGLTGFKCRCGTTFCGTHRYPEQHRCTFDFKAVGKEAIAKANPVVKGEKLDKI